MTSLSIVAMVKYRVQCAGHEDRRNAYRILVGNRLGKCYLVLREWDVKITLRWTLGKWWRWSVDGTIASSCPVAGFGISGAESLTYCYQTDLQLQGCVTVWITNWVVGCEQARLWRGIVVRLTDGCMAYQLSGDNYSQMSCQTTWTFLSCIGCSWTCRTALHLIVIYMTY
jgi:hypothetical protein